MQQKTAQFCLKAFSAFVILVFMEGCVSLTSVSISDISKGSKDTVTESASGVGFLGLTTPSPDGLEREVVRKLASRGGAANISTRMQVRNFLIVQIYSVSGTATKASSKKSH